MARVILAMSGGVDSSVAAHLLRSAGHEVIGLFMRHGHQVQTCDTSAGGATNSLEIVEPSSHKQGCCTASDARDARRVAERLDIPFYAVNFDEPFTRIMDYFADEYAHGRTPNPCVMCNSWLKFGKLVEYADQVGAEFVATGHYARISPGGEFGEVGLLAGLDGSKDQSYVLFGVDRCVLPRMLLPVGGYEKPAIRRLAAEIGLGVADKKDSQEICFIPDHDHAGFVRKWRPDSRAGEIVTTSGEVVGRHAGIEGFTVGQRKGLGVAMGAPRYVVRVEPDSRQVVIGEEHELDRREFMAQDANWLIDPPERPLECEVKVRYRSAAVQALVEPLSADRFAVRLATPRRGIAPGQAAVCYRGDRVLGGGWIES